MHVDRDNSSMGRERETRDRRLTEKTEMREVERVTESGKREKRDRSTTEEEDTCWDYGDIGDGERGVKDPEVASLSLSLSSL